jgi:hypothetical protein
MEREQLHFPRKHAHEVSLDPATILMDVHRGRKKVEPAFPLLYKKIKSFPVIESEERGKLIKGSW